MEEYCLPKSSHHKPAITHRSVMGLALINYWGWAGQLRAECWSLLVGHTHNLPSSPLNPLSRRGLLTSIIPATSRGYLGTESTGLCYNGRGRVSALPESSTTVAVVPVQGFYEVQCSRSACRTRAPPSSKGQTVSGVPIRQLFLANKARTSFSLMTRELH